VYSRTSVRLMLWGDLVGVVLVCVEGGESVQDNKEDCKDDFRLEVIEGAWFVV